MHLNENCYFSDDSYDTIWIKSILARFYYIFTSKWSKYDFIKILAKWLNILHRSKVGEYYGVDDIEV